MGQYITAGLIGSLVTIIVQGVINAITERVKHKRELRSMIFQRKLEVVEKAMSWYQEALDMYYIFQVALREYDKDCNPATVHKLQVSLEKYNKLYQETECRLNAIYLYYDFSDINKKYHGRESLEVMNKAFALLHKIGYDMANIQPSESAERLSDELQGYRVEVSHLLSDAIDNQIAIIAEIQLHLRSEYKAYFK